MAKEIRNGSLNVSRVCEPGRNNGYFAFPSNARMLATRARCKTVEDLRGEWNRGTFVAVTHTDRREQHPEDDHYYYLANGCSDMHLLVQNAVVGFNQADVAVKLLARLVNNSESSVVHDVEKNLHATNRTLCGAHASSLLHERLRMTPCSPHFFPVSGRNRCIWGWRPDILTTWRLEQKRIGRQVSDSVLRLTSLGSSAIAHALEVDTLIYLFKGSGAGDRGVEGWKTEVERVKSFTSDVFFDSQNRPCGKVIVGGRDQCVTCGSMHTPLLHHVCSKRNHFE